MDFRIADTFTASLQKLTAAEQKAVKTTAFDLQLDPKAPGLSFHKLDRAKDPNFWSVRVGADIRLIVHRTASSLLLVYADHHDAAYRWAERRRIERHPTTGAAQLVELREEVRPVAAAAPASPARKPLFAATPEATLLAYGVPPDWLGAVRAADEDGLFDLADHLPQEAMEALLTLATGAAPPLPVAAQSDADPFRHPDAERRFRLLTDAAELRQALDYPWARWSVFLRPDQRSLVERRFAGPARVTGSAGTGKTVVALHRAVALARRYPGARILLTTFSATLAQDLALKLAELVGGDAELAGHVTVRAIHDVGRDLFPSRRRRVFIASSIASGIASASLTRPVSCCPNGRRSSMPGRSTIWNCIVACPDWAARLGSGPSRSQPACLGRGFPPQRICGSEPRGLVSLRSGVATRRRENCGPRSSPFRVPLGENFHRGEFAVGEKIKGSGALRSSSAGERGPQLQRLTVVQLGGLEPPTS